MSSAGDAPYQITMNQVLVERVRGLAQRAAELGVYDSFIQSLQTIEDQLGADPLAWGDPTQNLPGLGMIAYRRIYNRLSVTYGVNEVQRVVWVVEIKPVLDHPLAGGD
jgi:hypothetical protein